MKAIRLIVRSWQDSANEESMCTAFEMGLAAAVCVPEYAAALIQVLGVSEDDRAYFERWARMAPIEVPA